MPPRGGTAVGRKAPEPAGWKAGTVQEFLGLTDEESKLVELRVAVALRVRQLRKKRKLTQEEFARKIGSSQPRVARLESGAPDVSLDLMFRGFFAAGGDLADLVAHARRPKVRKPRKAVASSETP
jgi:DNA-binding XRE family transcriptional regulator